MNLIKINELIGYLKYNSSRRMEWRLNSNRLVTVSSCDQRRYVTCCPSAGKACPKTLQSRFLKEASDRARGKQPPVMQGNGLSALFKLFGFYEWGLSYKMIQLVKLDSKISFFR